MPMRSKLHKWQARVNRKREVLNTARAAGAEVRELRCLRRNLSRCTQRRNVLRDKRTRHILLQRQRILQAQQQGSHRCKNKPKIATWNTRGLGAIHATNTPAKIKCFIHSMLEYNWGCVAVTDLRGNDGTLEFQHTGRSWTLITHQRVGFLLDDVWTQWWQEGQSKLYPNGDRVLGIQFQRRGWRRGFLTTVYAPTSDSTTGERQLLRDQVNQVLGMKEPASMTLVLGDFNAEMGNTRDPHQVGNIAMEPFGWPKTTVAGREWRIWAEVGGFRDCTSRYQIRHRTTWAHPRFLSEHELDHIFIHESCLWHVVGARVLQEGPSVCWPWGNYTDHNPVEITLRHGKLWLPKVKGRPLEEKPDVAKMRGNTDEAIRLRDQWQQEVDRLIGQLEAQPPNHPLTADTKWVDICRICRR